MMRPKISIGLPVYNGENYLAMALDSILAQEFGDFELIICDNASQDRTGDIALEFAQRDPRIRYHRNPVNLGAAQNFNRSLELATAPFFKWAAHDDLLRPAYLNKCLSALEAAPDAVLCQSLVQVIDEGGEPVAIYDSRLTGADSIRQSERFRALVLSRHLCTEMFGLMRTELLRRSNMHGAYYGGDRSMLAELSLLGRFVQVREPLFLNREHPERFVRAVPATRWMEWHDRSKAKSRRAPTWQLYRDYWDAVSRHVRDPAERLACRRHLMTWWLVDWNLGRLTVDMIGKIDPAIYELVKTVKLRMYGKMPQVRDRW